jgi:hypothetical protein
MIAATCLVQDKTIKGEAYLQLHRKKGIKIKILSSAILLVSHALSLPAMAAVHFANMEYCFLTVRHKDTELKQCRNKQCRTRFLNQA